MHKACTNCFGCHIKFKATDKGQRVLTASAQACVRCHTKDHEKMLKDWKWVGQELTWGKHYDNWDFDHTKLVVNFGSGVLDAHTNHIPTAQRLVTAMVNRGVKMYTFDPRLGNTAARSTEWLTLKPGTDRAVEPRAGAAAVQGAF